MSFTEIGFREDKLVRLDIKINGEDAPPLATIVHRDKAHDIGKIICNKLKNLIPRQQFKVPIQGNQSSNTVVYMRLPQTVTHLFCLVVCSLYRSQACSFVSNISA
jgi:translation elongation factor EF-4